MKTIILLFVVFFMLVFVAQATMVCPQCGKTYTNDFAYCEEDGTKLVKVKPKPQPKRSQTKVVGPGIKLIRIPGGTFRMGSYDGEEDEKPVHTVTVSGFWMGEAEITIQQYCDFLNSQRPDESTRRSWISIRSDHSGYPTEIWYENDTYRPTSGYGNNPVNSISWLGAQAFCEHYGLRLPTEAEWEYAAGGPYHYKYPWGNEWVEGMCCCNRTWRKREDPCPTVAVKSYPANGYGLYDMAGNLWEWCSDWYDVYPGGSRDENMGKYRLLCGGSWRDDASGLRCANRGSGGPAGEGLNFGLYGFRVSGD